MEPMKPKKRGRPKKNVESEPISEEAKKIYSLTLDTNGEQVTFIGDTAKECLDQITKKNLKTKSKLFFTKGELKAEIYLYPPRMKQLVANKLYRAILDKRINLLLT